MMYKYLTINSLGEKIQGYIQAKTSSEAILYIKAKNTQIISIKIAWWKSLTIRNKLSNLLLYKFCYSVHQLLKTKIHLQKILEIIAENSNKTIKNISVQLKDDIDKGHSLYQACKNNKYLQNTLVAKIIESSEQTGNLEEAFEYLHKQYHFTHNMRKKIITAIYYPASLLIMTLPILYYFLTYMIPSFAQLSIDNGQSISSGMKALLSLNNVLTNHKITLSLGIVCIAAILITLNKKFHLFIKLGHKISITKKMISSFYTCLFFYTLNQMLKQNLNMIIALKYSLNNVHSIFKTELDKMILSIENGESISQAIKAVNFFSKDTKQLLSIGEQSNSLEHISNQLIDYHEEKLTTSLNRLQQILQPLLILIIGSIFLLFTILSIVPMYSQLNQLQL